MAKVYVDSSEVNALAVTLSMAPKRLRDEVGEVMDNEADALWRAMRRDARNHRYLPKFARELNHDRLSRTDHEIGFDKTGQGNLATIIVHGSVNNAPVYDFYRQLHIRTPFLVEHLANIAEGAAFGLGRRRI